jgi:hypothetical protein
VGYLLIQQLIIYEEWKFWQVKDMKECGAATTYLEHYFTNRGIVVKDVKQDPMLVKVFSI